MLILYVALIALFFFSCLDLTTRRLNNWLIGGFLLIGMIYRYFTENLLISILGMSLMACFSILLWKKKLIGGADAKLLPALVPYLYSFGLPNMLVNLFSFTIEFGIIASLYGFVCIKIFKEMKEIPLIPAITLAFMISVYFRFN